MYLIVLKKKKKKIVTSFEPSPSWEIGLCDATAGHIEHIL